ncbi:MAG: carboxypeptidase-like regulatory domain-containing protein, partial [Phycisphaerae bacterium]|nr:carboxypeptidase-like regulatory domain-containing protein [Phycisphaerae bacterium]
MSWKRLLGGCGLFFVMAAHAAQTPVALDDVVNTLPRFDVSGQVVDNASAPIADAEVWLYYARGQAGLRDRLAGYLKTEADGTFAFEQAMVWEPQTEDTERFEPHYSVIARHPDHGLYFANLFEGDAADQVKLRLTPRETRTVTVTDPDGTPVAGATVFICGGRLCVEDCEGKDRKYTYLRVNQDLGIVSAVTDDQGKATGTCLDDGYFLVTKPGYKKTWVPGNKAILFSGASVSGTVRYPDGTPAAGAAVWYSYSGDRLGWDDVTVANANGHYEFAHVAAAGFYYSWMNPDDEANAQGNAAVQADDLRVGSSLLCKKETFQIKPGEHLKKDLTFADSVTLSGRIMDVGTNRPVPRMGLSLLTRAGGQSLDSKAVTVDENGRFSVAVAPGSHVQFSWEESRTEGLYLIDEAWQQQGSYNPTFRQVVNDDVSDLVFNVKLVPLQPLTGQVVDEQGQGVARASVYIHSDLPPARTDETGAFAFKGVFAQKAFDLYAESVDQSAAGIMHIEAGVTEAKIVLRPTQDYKGLVSSTDGVPAGDLKFYLDLKINDSTVYRVRREPKTDDDGRFDVENLCPAARYYAWWSSDNEDNRDYDYGNADIDLTGLSEEGVITFQAKQYLNVIMGTVKDEQGQPIAKA